jgi:hypothetical protein
MNNFQIFIQTKRGTKKRERKKAEKEQKKGAHYRQIGLHECV